MKELELQGSLYIVPTSWKEVTLERQIYVVENNDKYTTETQKKIGILSGYSGIPFPILKKINVSELKELFTTMKFINEPLPKTAISEFTFNGSRYYVGQNLLEQEFQDYISLQNTYQEYKGKETLALPTIIAILSRKKLDNGLLETLDDYDLNKRIEEFKKIDLVTANSLSLFFSQNIRELSVLFQQFSNPKEILEMKMDEVESTLKKQVGQGWLTKCVNGILRIYLKYIRRRLNKHFIF